MNYPIIPKQVWYYRETPYPSDDAACAAKAADEAEDALDAILTRHKIAYERAINFDDLKDHAAEIGAALTAYAEAMQAKGEG